ncbi:MAG TPA: Gfo/Idh/MocA family oxidoreductase [Anaerolineae bacterium]|nr:Gfo/Idh/MocA family oxidoreductase [Anaerolineae bacterium]
MSAVPSGAGTIRMAVVGVGRMGLTHAENLARRVRGARLVAVTTSDPRRAAEVRRAAGEPGPAVYPDLDALLRSSPLGLDAICIASSTSAHAANVVTCAQAGLHIFCEKPLALTLEDCDRAIDAARRANVKLMVGHMRRFDAGHIQARRYIEEGAIGRPLVFRAISGDVNPPPPSFADPKVSGGLLLDAMYHDLYLSRWLLDDEPIRAFVEGGALVDPAVGAVGDVDNAVAVLRFSRGGLGSFYVTRTTRYGHDLRVEVIGEQGAVQVGRFRQTPVRLLDPNGVHHDMPWTTPDRMGEAFVTEMQAFVDCLLDGSEPPVDGQEGRATVAAALAATRALREGRPVDL